MRPIDGMRAAISNAAELLGTGDRGRLAPGKLADVIAVSGDPSADIRTLERPAFIIMGGKRINGAPLAS